ncbi:MAG: lipoate--protein ligase family protein, partial [Candidatus Binatia bacterium]
HLILPNDRLGELALPLRLADRYPRLAAPAIAAYRRLGVAASFRPVNDIHVNGRKIGGTGTASIADAFVFVGSMMIDFDHGLMARVLSFSDEKMRDKVRASMEEYVTSLRRETGAKLRMEYVRHSLLEGFRAELGLDLEPGILRGGEVELAEQLDVEFLREEWLHRICWQGARTRRLAINCAVRYLEAEHKAEGGLLRMSVRVVDGKVDDLLLSGDFSLVPGEATECIRNSFLGAPLGAPEFLERAQQAWGGGRFEMPGVSPEDFSALTRKLVEAAGH